MRRPKTPPECGELRPIGPIAAEVVAGHMATRVDDIATHFEAPLGEHSEKPEKFYQIVKRLSYPPYGEAFQRKERDWINNLFREQEAAA